MKYVTNLNLNTPRFNETDLWCSFVVSRLTLLTKYSPMWGLPFWMQAGLLHCRTMHRMHVTALWSVLNWAAAEPVCPHTCRARRWQVATNIRKHIAWLYILWWTWNEGRPLININSLFGKLTTTKNERRLSSPMSALDLPIIILCTQRSGTYFSCWAR